MSSRKFTVWKSANSIAMHVQLEPRRHGDVDQQLSNAARVGRGTEAVFVFGDLLSNLNCVGAYQPEGGSQIAGTVVSHAYPPLH